MRLSVEAHQIGDILSATVVLGVLQDWMPAMASGLAVVWSLIRIFEWIRWRLIQRRHEPFQ